MNIDLFDYSSHFATVPSKLSFLFLSSSGEFGTHVTSKKSYQTRIQFDHAVEIGYRVVTVIIAVSHWDVICPIETKVNLGLVRRFTCIHGPKKHMEWLTRTKDIIIIGGVNG